MPPTRMCVVTRESASPEALVRIFAAEGVARVDWWGRWKGRGAWLTCTRAVFEEAQKKPGLLQRALEEPKLDVSTILAQAQEANLTAVLDLLSLSARAGAIASGSDVLDRMDPASLTAWAWATDASASTVDGFRARAGCPEGFPLPLDREALGRRIGKGPRALVGLRRASPTRALLEQLRRMHALG